MHILPILSAKMHAYLGIFFYSYSSMRYIRVYNVYPCKVFIPEDLCDIQSVEIKRKHLKIKNTRIKQSNINLVLFYIYV